LQSSYIIECADYTLLKLMLPWALVGVFITGISLSMISSIGLNLLIGSSSILFCLQYLLKIRNKTIVECTWFWSLFGGFSSTTIHAGSGSISIYLLPKSLDKITLIATMALLFGFINFFKLIP